MKTKELTKKEIEWIFNEIEVTLDSYREQRNIRGLTFEGTFSSDLSKEDVDIMKSIYNKLLNLKDEK